MKAEHDIIALIIEIRTFLKDLHDSQLEPFLRDWPASHCRARPVSANPLPVLSYMPAAVKAADKKTESIVTMLSSLASQIAWGQTYSEQDCGTRFLEKYGWTEFIGLRGPIANNHMACGILFLGPRTEYPLHSHEAEEVYIPLTKHTLWRQGRQGWVERPAGLPISHAAWEPHGMQTKLAPLLAVYLWRKGNLVQKSHIE